MSLRWNQAMRIVRTANASSSAIHDFSLTTREDDDFMLSIDVYNYPGLVYHCSHEMLRLN